MVIFRNCVCVKDLEQSVEEDNAGELVLGISLPDNEGQCDGGRQFITAVRLSQAGLPAGHTGHKGHFCSIRQTPAHRNTEHKLRDNEQENISYSSSNNG